MPDELHLSDNPEIRPPSLAPRLRFIPPFQANPPT